MSNKKYPNNNAWPGVRALLYNIQLDSFFDKNHFDVFNDYEYRLTDIGFEWKKNDETRWNTISVRFPSKTNTYITNITDINDGSESMADERYCCKLYSPNAYCIHPIRVLIKNLEPDTSYNIRSYFSLGTETSTYNEQTVKTIDNPSNITFAETVYEQISDRTEEIEEKIEQREEIVKEIFDMFYSSVEKEYKLVIGTSKAEGMYSSERTIRFFPRRMINDYEGNIWVFIHEMAHDLMYINANNWENSSEEYKNEVTKFMEFATNAPNATWKWISSHNNPIISSEHYDYMDNCLVVAACELSKKKLDL